MPGYRLTEKGLLRWDKASWHLGSKRTNASYGNPHRNTVAKILERDSPVDKQSIEQCFKKCGIELEGDDIESFTQVRGTANGPILASEAELAASEEPYAWRPFYDPFETHIDAGRRLIHLIGPHSVGKTAALHQGALHARSKGSRVAITDVSSFSEGEKATLESFCRAILHSLCGQFGIKIDLGKSWNSLFPEFVHLEDALKRHLFTPEKRSVWMIDNVDAISGRSYCEEFYRRIRSWFNSKQIANGIPWDKVTLVLAYSTESHLLLQSPAESPFNVGEVIPLSDFTPEETTEFCGRFENPLSEQEAERLHELLGGNPCLIKLALEHLVSGKETFEQFMSKSATYDGVFIHHLQRMKAKIELNEGWRERVENIFRGKKTNYDNISSRMRSAGILKRNVTGQVELRCKLYETFLKAEYGK